MQLLEANTQVVVRIGPFVAVGDGFTPQTGITLAAADEAELLKHNGAATVSIASNTWAAIAGADGWYDLTLTTTDTNTEGLLTVVVQDDSVCLPVFTHFMVMAQASYDSMFGAKDTGYMDVNVTTIENADATTQINAEVVDALATDTYAEPGQGAPAATASLATKIGHLYKRLRNKETQTSTTYSLYDDAGTTVDQKATISDDGTTFTKGEIVSGP